MKNVILEQKKLLFGKFSDQSSVLSFYQSWMKAVIHVAL